MYSARVLPQLSVVPPHNMDPAQGYTHNIWIGIKLSEWHWVCAKLDMVYFSLIYTLVVHTLDLNGQVKCGC